MPLPPDYTRVTRRNRCPICDSPDWCMVKLDGTEAVCPRVPEGSVRAWWSKKMNFLGYVHTLREDVGEAVRRRTAKPEPETKLDAAAVMYALRYEGSPNVRHTEISADLGVTRSSVARLGSAWHYGMQAAAFPMSDETGRYIGIRLRRPSGFKWAVKGSLNGLFLPSTLPDGPVLLPEGPTDTAACLDLGFAAIGRPCAQAGFYYVADWFCGNPDRWAVVVGEPFDKRGDGVRFAERLADLLVSANVRTQVIYPPSKDIRRWKQEGATREDVQELIDNAPLRRRA